MYNILIWIFICLVTWERGAAEYCKTNASCIYEDIFEGYNRLVRPVTDPKQVIHIELQLTVKKLLDIVETDEVMSVVGFITAKWTDIFLRWDPAKFGGVTDITVPANTVWLPDIGVSNSVSGFYDITYKRDFQLKITNTGEINWSFGGVFMASCNMRLYYYPFEIQTCTLEVESWQYTRDMVTLHYDPDEGIHLERLEANQLWILNRTEVENILKYNETYSAVIFSLEWERKILYYYVNIIIPIGFLTVITLCAFWVPASCGEKISVCVTILLAYIFMLTYIMETIPVNSEVVPRITQVILLVVVASFMSLLSAMFVVFITDRKVGVRPPKWMRVLFLRGLPKIMCMTHIKVREDEQLIIPKQILHRSISQYDENVEVSGSNNNGFKKDLHDVTALLSGFNYYLRTQILNEDIKEDWKNIGNVIDRLLFWITLLTLLGYILFLLLLEYKVISEPAQGALED